LLVEHFLRIYCAPIGFPLRRSNPRRWRFWKRTIGRECTRAGKSDSAHGADDRRSVIAPKHLPQQILYSSAAKQEELLIPEVASILTKKMERMKLPIFKPPLIDNGKKAAAAELLRIDRQRIHYLCRKHKLKSD